MQILRTTLNQLLHAHMLLIKQHFEELTKNSTPLPMMQSENYVCFC